ncbi:MAG: adenylosuccinate synthase [Thermodesulfobacteriota bacterium]
MRKRNKNSVFVGAQWGDEGKGRIVDLVSNDFDIIARFQGGSNAGHTIIIKNKKIVLHHIPSGVLRKNKVSVIGNGTVIDLEILAKEIRNLRKNGFKITSKNLRISSLAHIITPYHKAIDKYREIAKGSKAIGTTGRGIGPAYEDKVSRQGIRMLDLQEKKTCDEKIKTVLKEKNKIIRKVFEEKGFAVKDISRILYRNYNYIKEFVCDTNEFLVQEIKKDKKVLFEGAQGAMLDLDFGTYPFVTSSSTISANASAGTGVPFSSLGDVVGVSKAYTTRVGHGPFPTEMFDETGLTLREFGTEYGATTGRPRRCGWLDLVALKHAITISGINLLALTKVDILSIFSEIKVCIAYKIGNKRVTTFPLDYRELDKVKPVYKKFPSWTQESLSSNKIPNNLKALIKFIEKFLEIKVSMISIGPERSEIIYL